MKTLLSWIKRCGVFAQFIMPKRLLSHLAGCLMQCTRPWVAQPVIKAFIRHYQVDLTEAAQQTPQAFEHFNAFFTRALAQGARPIASGENILISPADGSVSQLGAIKQGQLIQAKGHDYPLAALLGDPQAQSLLNKRFSQGSFATVYLSPRDYHRVHMPLTGRLMKMRYIPGKLFSVNPLTAQYIKQLFTRNERLVCFFDTAQGEMAVIFVGAMLVASIATRWAGIINPTHQEPLQTWEYENNQVIYTKGEEIGHFQLGSTVIIVTQRPFTQCPVLHPGEPIKMGESLGLFNKST